MAKAKKNGNGATDSTIVAATAKPVYKLARRHKTTSVIEPRKAGRPNPDFEKGYLDQENTFHVGEPPKRNGGKLGRPLGATKAKAMAVAALGGGSVSADFERIIQRALQNRMKAAAVIGMDAFKKALGV